MCTGCEYDILICERLKIQKYKAVQNAGKGTLLFRWREKGEVHVSD